MLVAISIPLAVKYMTDKLKFKMNKKDVHILHLLVNMQLKSYIVSNFQYKPYLCHETSALNCHIARFRSQTAHFTILNGTFHNT